MSVFALPIDADPSTHLPAFPGQSHRVAQAALMGAGSPRPLGAVSGKRPGGGLALTVTTTTWSVSPGSAIVDTAFSTTSGPYLVVVDAVTAPAAITAADSANPRYDIVYIKIEDKPVDGGANRQASLGYLTGVPAATPSLPAAPAGCFMLGWILVPKATTGSPSATSRPLYSVASGGILPVADAATRDGLTQSGGLAVYRLDLGVIETSNGTAWQRWQKPPQSGSDSLVIAVGTNGQFKTVTFPTPFTAPPRVVPLLTNAGNYAMNVTAITTTTCSVKGFRTDASNAPGNQTVTFDWLAFGDY